MATTKTQQKTRRSTRPAPKRHPGRATRTSRASRARTAARRAAPAVQVNEAQVQELILQALETELGGVQIYRTAVACAVNKDLKEEWQEYLEQTERHVEIVQGVCQQLGIDLEEETPGRLVVRHLGESLVQAMQRAQASGPAEAAQLVAAECVVLAETKDHQNWTLLGELVDALDGERKTVIEEACDEVEDEEDEHLYHTMGWSRELWIESLGLPAVLPPPEEEKDVKSMAGAAKAKAGRKAMVKKSK
jgi:rubrerythrin